MKNLTLEQINKINKNQTKLEKLCSTLISEIDKNMKFNDTCTSGDKQFISLQISKIETELQTLKEECLNK
mgnify:FL=1|tara:strand:- start:275 stop:484 length:210 start_codon:yes stop_codon:yes gene_type:complete